MGITSTSLKTGPNREKAKSYLSCSDSDWTVQPWDVCLFIYSTEFWSSTLWISCLPYPSSSSTRKTPVSFSGNQTQRITVFPPFLKKTNHWQLVQIFLQTICHIKMSDQLGIRSKIRLESVSLENSQKQSPSICEEICTDRLLDQRRQARHPRGFLCFGYSMCLHQKYSSSSQVLN